MTLHLIFLAFGSTPVGCLRKVTMTFHVLLGKQHVVLVVTCASTSAP